MNAQLVVFSEVTLNAMMASTAPMPINSSTTLACPADFTGPGLAALETRSPSTASEATLNAMMASTAPMPINSSTTLACPANLTGPGLAALEKRSHSTASEATATNNATGTNIGINIDATSTNTDITIDATSTNTGINIDATSTDTGINIDADIITVTVTVAPLATPFPYPFPFPFSFPFHVPFNNDGSNTTITTNDFVQGEYSVSCDVNKRAKEELAKCGCKRKFEKKAMTVKDLVQMGVFGSLLLGFMFVRRFEVNAGWRRGVRA
ncbi:hypothetical protein P280DRAFT_37800 [Massarina eburnea CBS 473.64]|uniref:Uncharacterized protein n=1 Tax=Massarina eburnea CBS 473.64 TaxID=1395130 RepID=A0A6A6RVT0_9PLEO|nr:hypothetical protein P280DRAFT_37800 [Massarina eburnea CBS 473.64]